MSIPSLAALDALLARAASANAAAALQAEAERRLAWRDEESECLLLASLEEVAPGRAGAGPEGSGVRAG